MFAVSISKYMEVFLHLVMLYSVWINCVQCAWKVRLIIEIYDMFEYISDIKNVKNLKQHGSLGFVKATIQKKSGLDVKSSSWDSLFEKVYKIQLAVKINRAFLEKIIARESYLNELGSFSEVKLIIKKAVGIKIPARGWHDLHLKLHKASSFLLLENEGNCNGLFLSFDDKKRIYEENRYRNFVGSSRLEGIEIKEINKTTSEVVEKYKAIGANPHGG